MIAKIVAAKGGGDFGRLGRYITDAKSEGRTTAAERLGAYVLDAAHDGEKVAWSRVTNCGADTPRIALIEIKHTQAMNTRATNKTLHLVVSFPEGERPSKDQLHTIEDKLCAALGMEDHQRLSALHTNTDHVHLHVAINRVHPETLKCADPSFGQRRLMTACHELEIALGLTRDNHGLGRDDQSRSPVGGRAADMEAQSGRESFTRWVQDHARDELLAAKVTGNWEALHQAAAAHGLALKPRGAGLVITDEDGSRAVKASSVDRGLSWPALTAACGPYQEPGLERAPAKERYEAAPLHRHAKTKDLFATYQKERLEAQQARTEQSREIRDRHYAYRQELGQWCREEKHKLRHGWLEQFSPDKPARYRELAKQQGKLFERSKAEEKAELTKLHAAHPLPTWSDWLQGRAGKGDLTALDILRSRAERQERTTAALLQATTPGATMAIIMRSRQPVVGRDGRVSYRLIDGGQVEDRADKVLVPKESRAAATLAVSLAATRFGHRPLAVEGSPEFRRWVGEDARRLKVRLADPTLGLEPEPDRLKPSGERLPDERPGSPEKPSSPYQRWSAGLEGEFTYLGLKDGPAGPSLVWRQGKALFAQAATPKAQLAAHDVEPGDRVIFFNGNPLIIESRDRDGGRNTGRDR